MCAPADNTEFEREKNIPTPLFSPFIIPVGKSQLQTACVATDPDEK